MRRVKYLTIVTLAIVIAAGITVMYPSLASAGSYSWQSCSGASQDLVNEPDPSSWSPVNNGSGWSLNSSGCKSVGSLGTLFDISWGGQGRLSYSNTGPMDSGNYWAGFSLHAPEGTVFSSLSWRQRILTTGGGNKCVLATSNIFSGAYTLAQNCFGPSTNWQDSGWVSRSANVSAAYNRDLLLVGSCIVVYGNCGVYKAGNQTTSNALHTGFDQINAVLSDTTAPAMSSISRPAGTGWIRGSWSATWSATDAMGIKDHRFLVDDAVGESNPFCDIPSYLGTYYGTSSQPCPNPGAEDYSAADFSIDTSAYSDASHVLKLQSSDATDVWSNSQSTIKTDNSPPTPPSFGESPADNEWVSSASTSFSFSAEDTQSGISSYQCQIDDGDFSTCESPKTLTLADGPHSICVRAFNNSADSDGVLDSSDGCSSFQIDRVTPTTTMNRPADSIAQAGTFISGRATGGESGLSEVAFEARQEGQADWQTLCSLTQSDDGLYSCEIDGVSLNIGDTYNLRMKSTSGSGLSSTSATYNAVVLPDTADAGALPANSALPSIGGVASPGETLNSSSGDWFGNPTFDYLWQTSDSGSDNWTTATGDGFDTSDYIVADGDMGKWLRVRVIGTNINGATTAFSLASKRVSSLPSSIDPPTLTGTAKVGVLISVSDGLWTGDPVPTMSYQWQVSTNGFDWTDAGGAGATTNSYLPQISDAGKYLQAIVRGNNWGGTTEAFSDISEEVGMSPSATNPTIEGTPRVSSRLSVVQPAIGGSPAPDLTYTWQRSGDNLNWEDISASGDYLLTSAEANKYVRVKLALNNSFGSLTVYSESALIKAQPENTALPTIGASARVGVAIPATEGIWTQNPDLTYQWQVSSNGFDWTNANGSGATTLSYSPVRLDSGGLLRLRVTAEQNTAAYSNSLTVNESPSFGEVTMSGDARIGGNLTASNASWRGYPTPTFSYQWQKSGDGFNFSNIEGEESLSYIIQEVDQGDYLRIKVTGSNSQGSSVIYSTMSRVVSRTPTNDSPPTISGQKVMGQTVTAESDGAWTSYPDSSFTYQWERCDPTCAEIASENGASYQLTRADVGHKIRLMVTADNQFDQVKSPSSQSATVEGVASNTNLPVIGGLAIIGGSLNVTDGSWSVWPQPSYSYAWQSCEGESCSIIADQNSSSYSPTPADSGKTIKALVTATNTHGQTTATSSASVPVHATANPPVNNTLPTISGVAETEQTYTSGNGDWSSDFELSYSHSWQRCDISGCETIIGANQNIYRTGDADAGKQIRLKVTATNADGATEAFSIKSATIIQTKPTNQSEPAISGNKTVASVLTIDKGTWLGLGNSYQIEWQRCNPNCATISTGPQYTLTTADLDANIKAIVTASNAHGSNSASSQLFGPVEAASVPPGGDTPGGDTPGGDTPGGDNPGGDTPGGGTPGGGTPGGGTPGGGTPGGGAPGGGLPGGDTPGGDTPGGGVCMGTSAISASKASVAGSKISFKAVPSSWGQTATRLQVQSNKPLAFSWMYDNKIIATIGKSKSSKVSLPAKTIGKHYLVLTAKSGKKIIKIKKAITVLLCPPSKSLLPAIKTINTKVGSGKFSVTIAKDYSADKPGLWLLKGRGSAVWKLDGKIISKKNSTLISPETLKIGAHKISLKITNKKKSKTIIIVINAH